MAAVNTLVHSTQTEKIIAISPQYLNWSVYTSPQQPDDKKESCLGKGLKSSCIWTLARHRVSSFILLILVSVSKFEIICNTEVARNQIQLWVNIINIQQPHWLSENPCCFFCFWCRCQIWKDGMTPNELIDTDGIDLRFVFEKPMLTEEMLEKLSLV